MSGGGQSASALLGAAPGLVAGGRERIVVAGAGGWLGLATLDLLSRTLGAEFDERVVCFGSNERSLALRGGRSVRQFALEDIARLPTAPTVVLHLAYLTKDRAAGMAAEDYRAANRAISGRVIDALDAIGAEAVFLASSGAAYRADDPTADETTRLYGQLKREDEAAIEAWASRAGARAVLARIFNLSGPYMNKLASYALSAFILDALADRPIEIKASRRVYRSYVAIRELMSLVFALLLDRTRAVTAFDTAGERAYEMGEIAQVVCKALGLVGHAIRRPSLENDAVDVYVGDRALYSQLGQLHGVDVVDFPNQVRETAGFLAGAAETKVAAR